MKNSDNIFTVELLCGYEQWWRYNVLITLICYDSSNEIIEHKSFTDIVLETETSREERYEPAGYDSNRAIKVASCPCRYAMLYLYIVTNTFPVTHIIRQCPPFEATVVVNQNSSEIERIALEVNQWGGATLTEYKIEAK